MEPNEEPFDAVMASAVENIERFGYTLVAVEASPETAPFAYTVGLTAIGEPEFMVLGGINTEYAYSVLEDLAYRVVKDGVRFKPGDTPSSLLQGGYEAMITGPVPAVMLDKYPPGLAGAIYGREAVRVYQVVYQDKGRLYPWQDGYGMPGQPYLNGGRG